MAREVDWSVIGRYSVMVALTQLIPVPLLDGVVENALRRRLVRRLASDAGVALSDDDLHVLADAPGGGCLGMVKAVVLWPFKKLLKTLLFVLAAKSMADTASEVMHRSLMLHEALERGWLPGDVTLLRQGLDTSLDKIDVRLVERLLLGAFRDHRDELNRVVWEATKIARSQARGERAEALVEATENNALTEAANTLGGVLTDTLRRAGVADEAVHWFVAEMDRLRAARAEQEADAEGADAEGADASEPDDDEPLAEPEETSDAQVPDDGPRG